MKKTAIISFIVCFILSLTSCDPGHCRFSQEYLSANVKSVEFIIYDNENATELFNERDKVKPFDFSKMHIIKTLPEEKKDDFINGLSELTLLQVWRHLDSPKGESVKINYIDGSFHIICCTVSFSCYYDSEGNVKHFIGNGGGNELLELIESLC